MLFVYPGKVLLKYTIRFLFFENKIPERAAGETPAGIAG
jgi:hypothetical protein